MSISLGTSPSPSPSSKSPAPWRRQAARFLVFGVPAVVFLFVISSPMAEFFGHAGAGLLERRSQREALAPMIEKARLWAVDYDTARAGDYVYWCVDHPSRGVAYLSGRPSQPIVVSNDEAMDLNSTSSGGKCAFVVAVIEGRKPQGLALRYIGTP